MKFRSITPEDYESVRQFLSEVGWQHRVTDHERFKKMLEHTNRTVVAVDGSRIVGFARALCDEVSNGYISMVAVAADKRGQGIGRELVRQLIKEDTESHGCYVQVAEATDSGSELVSSHPRLQWKEFALEA